MSLTEGMYFSFQRSFYAWPVRNSSARARDRIYFVPSKTARRMNPEHLLKGQWFINPSEQFCVVLTYQTSIGLYTVAEARSTDEYLHFSQDIQASQSKTTTGIGLRQLEDGNERTFVGWYMGDRRLKDRGTPSNRPVRIKVEIEVVERNTQGSLLR